VKRELVHNLILNGGKADVTTMKETSEGLFVENDHFEQVLWEIAEQQKDTKGKSCFKLKEDKYL
jgi:hypothetical protein